MKNFEVMAGRRDPTDAKPRSLISGSTQQRLHPAEADGRRHKAAGADDIATIVRDLCLQLDAQRADTNRTAGHDRAGPANKSCTETPRRPPSTPKSATSGPGLLAERAGATAARRLLIRPDAQVIGRVGALTTGILQWSVRFRPQADRVLHLYQRTMSRLGRGAAATARMQILGSLRHAIFNRLTNLLHSRAEAGLPSANAEATLGELPPSPPVEKWIRSGLTIIVVAFCGFGLWATLAPLTSASMASGIVKVDSNRKTLQHYEGGIIQEILVRDGDVVRQGQVLVRLDDLAAQADQGALRSQLDALTAREARLIAQRDGRSEIRFPESLHARRADVDVALTMEGQLRIFRDQESALEAETAVWRQRAEQYNAQIQVINAQNETLTKQLESFEAELEVAKDLFERGYERKPRVLGLEREVTGGRGELMANEGRILALREQIAEAEAQISSLRQDRRRSVSEELREVQTSRAELDQMMRKSTAEVGRMDVVAPQDGVIVDLRYFTAGGVIAPGAEIMDIVPVEDKLIVEARIQPMDVDVVRPDLPAVVRLVAFKQGTTPTLDGKVTRMSADAVSDERTGEVYFLATVEVEPEELARVPHVKLYPGMPVEVAVVNGERTLVQYIMQPLTDSFAHAFREN